MAIVCTNCNAKIGFRSKNVDGDETRDVHLAEGICECESGPILALFLDACGSCGKSIKHMCEHEEDMSTTSGITRYANAKAHQTEGSNLTISHLWKELARAADAVHAYTTRDHYEPKSGLKETAFGQALEMVQKMGSMLPPEMMAQIGPAIAAMAAGFHTPPPICAETEPESFSVAGKPTTREEAFASCIEKGISPGIIFSSEAMKMSGCEFLELLSAAGFMLVYRPDTDDYIVSDEADVPVPRSDTDTDRASTVTPE